jgi:hypothetical protein
MNTSLVVLAYEKRLLMNCYNTWKKDWLMIGLLLVNKTIKQLTV